MRGSQIVAIVVLILALVAFVYYYRENESDKAARLRRIESAKLASVQVKAQAAKKAADDASGLHLDKADYYLENGAYGMIADGLGELGLRDAVGAENFDYVRGGIRNVEGVIAGVFRGIFGGGK